MCIANTGDTSKFKLLHSNSYFQYSTNQEFKPYLPYTGRWHSLKNETRERNRESGEKQDRLL